MKKSELPLWVEVKQSNYLLAFIISVHCLALANSMLLAIMLPLKFLLLFLVCSSLYFHVLRYKQGFYLLTLKYTNEFAWELVEKKTISSIRILNSSVLTSFIIILHIEINGKPRNVLVCRDSVSSETYRQLIVALKITTTDNPKNIS